MELRLKEAAKLGFKRAIVPRGQVYPEDVGLEIVPVGKVIEAIVAAIPQQRFGEDSGRGGRGRARSNGTMLKKIKLLGRFSPCLC
jgi:hypothetical protein